MHRRSKRKLVGWVCYLLFFAVPLNHTWAQGSSKKKTGVVKKSKKPKPWFKKIAASATLTTSVGSGSFSPSPSYQNHFVAQSLQISLGYSVWKGLSLSAGWGFDLEYTRPDNASGRRFLPRDVNLSVAWGNPIEAMKKYLTHSISLSFQLPASLLAQVQTRYLWAELGLMLGYSIKKYVRFRYSFGIGKSFNRYTSPIFNQGDAGLPSILLRQSTRTALDIPEGQVPMPGVKNISWQVRNSLSVTFHPHKTVTIGVAFGLFNAFRYPSPIDQFTPSIPTVEGDIQADSVGRIDFTTGNVFVSYRPVRHFGLSVGAFSLQTPLMANNKNFRFPFFNFVTANDNTTTFYLSLTGSI